MGNRVKFDAGSARPDENRALIDKRSFFITILTIAAIRAVKRGFVRIDSNK
jgi:hypothetical protein